jgi:predicted nucleic acid-binding protein
VSAPPVYCVDTSSLLEARTRRYPPEVFVTLWEKVEQLVAMGRFLSSEEVLREIEKKADETHTWAKNRRGMFVPLDRTQTTEVRRILGSFPLLVGNTTGRSRADPFVIALAKMNDYTLVTEERPGSPKRPKIPDVCAAWGVEVITFLELVRREGWTF